MTSGELLELFREQMRDIVAPYLWSDDEIYGYIDDAQSMYCRWTDGIADARTVGVTQLAVTAGDSYKDLHPSLLKIRSATRLDTGAPVEVLNYEDLATRGWRYDGVPGRVKAIVIGEEERAYRTYPVSNEDLTIALLVFRMPLVPIVDDQAIEVAQEHHIHLLHWVKRHAYLKQDTETFDRTKSLEFEQKFKDYCGMVKEETRRKAHKNRTVAYGGI